MGLHAHGKFFEVWCLCWEQLSCFHLCLCSMHVCLVLSPLHTLRTQAPSPQLASRAAPLASSSGAVSSSRPRSRHAQAGSLSTSSSHLLRPYVSPAAAAAGAARLMSTEAGAGAGSGDAPLTANPLDTTSTTTILRKV